MVPNPTTSAPAGGAAASQPKSGGCGKGKRKGRLAAEIFLVGLLLLPALM